MSFLRRMTRVQDFWILQFVGLLFITFYGVRYVNLSLKKVGDSAYSAELKTYSGVLTNLNQRKGIDEIVIDGENGKMKFLIGEYSTYTKRGDLEYFIGANFDVSYHKAFIVSCTDDRGGECIPKCATPLECEQKAIKSWRDTDLLGIYAGIGCSMFGLIASFIKILFGDEK